ncbi:endocuticle structural glycoprotein ABD-4 [Microplitis demolitor]|uniref:endocuticle structural glycoprotein ABD-4 n=1 Tax=Microplitis demolitor TaxID=69319 RepID=UPI0004CDC507|nr:endocuticle structural glycoprotein ABD-4 [Microplitis demolitor]
MKFLVVAFALVAVAAAQHQHVTPVPIAILRQSHDQSPEGAYQYSYDTEHGIHVDEQGQPGPVGEEGTPAIVARGSFSYTGPDGTPYQVTYTADETGFHPEGAHLPVAPPVPEEILRALDYNAAHPEENEGTLSGSFQPGSSVKTVPTPQVSQGFAKPNFGRRF